MSFFKMLSEIQKMCRKAKYIYEDTAALIGSSKEFAHRLRNRNNIVEFLKMGKKSESEIIKRHYFVREKIEKKAKKIPDHLSYNKPMKFPYTFSAKIAQFPYKYYFKNQWIWHYWIYGILLSLPVFYKIHIKANSPENIQKFRELKAKDEEEEELHHH